MQPASTECWASPPPPISPEGGKRPSVGQTATGIFGSSGALVMIQRALVRPLMIFGNSVPRPSCGHGSAGAAQGMQAAFTERWASLLSAISPGDEQAP